jgi:hypothetical protein
MVGENTVLVKDKSSAGSSPFHSLTPTPSMGLFCFVVCHYNINMQRINIFIDIQSQDEELGTKLMEVPKIFDRKVDLPADVLFMKVHPSDSNVIKGKIMFLLSFGNKVDPSLLADWLYEKITGRATQLCMDRIEVSINKTEIERIITERIGKRGSFNK